MLEGIWWASYAALWILVLVETAVIWALMRQVGLLHLRIQPAGARTTNMGPEIGATLPKLETKDILGNSIHIVDGNYAQLLLFIAPTCSACEGLLPAVKTIAKSEKNQLAVILITSVEDTVLNYSYIEKHELSGIPYVVSSAIAEQYGMRGSPYAMLIDKGGTVRAKGIVNHIEHLESLVEALSKGHPTMESYLEMSRTKSNGR